MKKALLLFCIACLLSSFSHTSPINHNYYDLDWRSFYRLPEVQQRIDLHNVNEDLLHAAIFFATNEVRSKKGLKSLSYHQTLSQAAESHSHSMVKDGFFDHTNPKSRSMRTPRNRVESFGGEFRLVAENILYCSPFDNPYDIFYIEKRNGRFVYLNRRTKQPLQTYTYLQLARKVVKMWMNSKGHRKNILSKEVFYLGCGTHFTPNPYERPSIPNIYATQNFASSK